MDNTAPSETSAPDRRRFLRTLGAGGAFGALAIAVSASKANASLQVPPSTAGASGGAAAAAGSAAGASGSTTAGTAAATTSAASTTTTIAAPKEPTANDLPSLKFAMQYELAIAGAYDAAISRIDASSLTLDAALVPVVRVFRQHHQAYGQALSALIGKTAPNGPNAAILASIVGPFQSGTAADVIKAAAAVENTAVATHLKILGTIEGLSAATLLASIVPIEARHAMVFEAAAGSTDLIPASGTESLTLALDPSKFASE